jgi:glycerol-3-phosphate dehydrogenase
MGIESPGLSASPAIAQKVVDIIKSKETLKPKDEFKTRRAERRFDRLDLKGKSARIESNPKHGHVICRCENVTEQEINNALVNSLGVKTLAGIKYRSRATMGRCQGGFCRARIIQIMEECNQMDAQDITFRGGDSRLFIGRTKDLRKHDSKKS